MKEAADELEGPESGPIKSDLGIEASVEDLVTDLGPATVEDVR